MIVGETHARAFVRERSGSDDAEIKLDRLQAMLAEENEHQNLVSAASFDAIWVRHFADSAQLLDHVPRETIGPWLDLGSGAGLPGLVIAILLPEAQVVLVESRRKRIEWLNTAVETLQLSNAVVNGVRVEALESFHAGVITARAFAPLPKLLNLSARFSTSATAWVLPKGQSAVQEVADLNPHLRKLFHVEQSVTDPDAGIIVGTGKVATRP